MAETALPLWAAAGWDPAAERFRERLDRAGAPLAVPHRSMVQARQIYVYAHAHLLGWAPDGGRLADVAMRSLVRDFAETAGGETSFAFSIDAGSGRVASAARDAYAHAFMLFAAAWLYRVTGDAGLLAMAERTNAFVKARFTDARHGGLYDALPLPASGGRGKRQNPLMHLLEAYLALERAAPGRGYLEDAAALVALFKARLFDERHGVLLEYFAEDWAPDPDPARADLFEPGHHFEWVWLLAEYGQLAGEDMRAWSDRLYDVARAHGQAPSGLIYDELGTNGAGWTPGAHEADGAGGPAVRKASHRVWPHTEAIKAAAARHAAGDVAALPFGHAVARDLLSTFLDVPFAGGWVDQVDPAGGPLVDYVPASSLYHLFFAAAEAARALGHAPAPAAPSPRPVP